MSLISINESRTVETLPKEAWIGWVSSLAEAYNMAIYSFIAPLLAPLIFQQTTADNAVFFSYCLALIGSCFLYPLGAIYYGFIGDKRGRQKTCIYSTLGLAVTTGMMGFVPLDFLAGETWIFFLVLICVQHFFSGGEYHGSIVFSLEHSAEKQSGLMSALSCLFAVFGLVAANGLATLSFLMENDLWIRVCFFMGALGGLISYVLKKHCQETPAFIAISQESMRGLNWSSFIKSNWKTIGNVVVVLAFFIVSYTFIFIFLPLGHFDQTTSQSFDTFKSLIAYGLFLVLAGLIADRIGIEKVMMAGIWLFAIAIIPSCYLCENLFVLQIILTACACLVIGPIHSWMLHQFEVKSRCRGIFMSSAIAMSIFGGSTVPICLLILDKSHSLLICCIYPLTIALGALSCLIFYRR